MPISVDSLPRTVIVWSKVNVGLTDLCLVPVTHSEARHNPRAGARSTDRLLEPAAFIGTDHAAALPRSELN